MRKYLMLLVVVIALAAVACEKIDDLEGIDRVRYEADYAVPLVDTKTSLEDLLEGFEENSTLLIDPDGTLRFLYKGDVIAQSSADVFESINESLPPIIPITSPNMALPFTSPDGIAIDRMDLKGGNLVYYFENRNTESVNVKVTFPQVTKNGVPLSYQHNLAAYSGTGNAPSASNLFLPTSLEGYTIATLNDSVYIQYQATTPGGDQKLLSSFIIRIQDLLMQRGILAIFCTKAPEIRLTLTFLTIGFAEMFILKTHASFLISKIRLASPPARWSMC